MEIMESSSKLNTSYVHNALVDLVDENHPNLKEILIEIFSPISGKRS